MIKQILFLLIIVAPLSVFSQEEIDFNKQDLFTDIDTMPSYVGDEEAIITFLNKKSTLQFIKNRGEAGFVSINFIVASNGEVYEPKILYSPSVEIGDEVKRLVKLTKWNSGIRKGKKVNVVKNLRLNLK